jgi:hypothetical protein
MMRLTPPARAGVFIASLVAFAIGVAIVDLHHAQFVPAFRIIGAGATLDVSYYK